MSEHSALFAEQTYNMSGSKSKEKRIQKINENIKHTGFSVDSKHSGRDILTFRNSDTNQTHISAKGTIPSRGKDLSADFMIGVNQEANSKQHKKVANQISKAVVDTPENHELTLSGHSLGGSLAVNSAVKKKNVRDKVKKIDTYNTASSAILVNKPSKKIVKELEGKVVNHRIDGDLVSSNYHNLIGEVKHYKPKSKKSFKNVPSVLQPAFKTLDQLNIHTISNFT